MSWSTIPVLGHGFADAGAYPVPLPILLLAAAGVVLAASALPGRPGTAVEPIAGSIGPAMQTVLRMLAAALLVAIVLPAAFGPDDAAANPAPRLLFTVGWAGLLLASSVFGPVWTRANPLRWATPPAGGDRLGEDTVWPAVAALLGFTLAEQVLEPSPLSVLIVVAVYVVGTMIGTTVFGHGWFRVVDPLECASRLIGRLAPLGRRGRRIVIRSVRAGVAATIPVRGTAAFLGVLIAANAYDAAAPTGAFVSRLGMFVAAAAAGGVVATAAARPLFLAPALIPAAASHVGAHYLAPLLVDTQIAAVQASDPFGLGWNILGLTGTEIVAEPISPFVGLTISYVLLVAGHALATVVANDIAARHVPPRAVGATLFATRAAIIASLAAGVYTRMGGR